jgi:hypothetical protein
MRAGGQQAARWITLRSSRTLPGHGAQQALRAASDRACRVAAEQFGQRQDVAGRSASGGSAVRSR